MAVSDDEIIGEIRTIVAEKADPDAWRLDPSGAASEESLRAVEESLCVVLPPSYRALLKSFGDVMLCQEFCCAGTHPLARQLETTNKRLRRYEFPKELIKFTDDGGDFTYCFDTSCPDANGEYPVVVVGPTGEIGPKLVASDFLDFVRRLSRGENLI